MIQFIYKIVLLISFILLISCEGETIFEKTIYNQSSDTLAVIFYSSYGSGQVDREIHPNESKLVFMDYKMGGFADDSYDCTQQVDSVLFTVSDDKILTKDIMDPDNWQLHIKDGRKSKVVCSFYINDSDLE